MVHKDPKKTEITFAHLHPYMKIGSYNKPGTTVPNAGILGDLFSPENSDGNKS